MWSDARRTVQLERGSVGGRGHHSWCEHRATEFTNGAVLHPALDQLVAEQREHAIADEQRARIAVPVDARGDAIVALHRFVVSAELAELLEARSGVVEKDDGGRIVEQLRVLRI